MATPKPASLNKAPVSAQEVLNQLKKHNVERVKVAGFDIDGVLRGKYLAFNKFEGALTDGFGFCDVVYGWDCGDVLYDNTQYTGWHTGYPDMPCLIDPASMRLIPWEEGTAFFLFDFLKKDNTPALFSPRQALKWVVSRAEAMGFSPRVAAEYEFFFFKETPGSLAEKSYRADTFTPLTPQMMGYSILRASQCQDLVLAIWDELPRFGIELEGFHTETGPGVYEAAIRYGLPVESADQAALFKTAVKEVAHRFGVLPTFMSKWNKNLPGSSGHLHQSLWDKKGTKNLFHDPKDPDGMSKIMRHYIAGQMEFMRALSAFTNPTINSYKRTVPGTWAPDSVSWGFDNRTCTLRVIRAPGPKSTRVEYRLTGGDINPHLALAATIAAGLYGITHELPLAEPVSGNAYSHTPRIPLPRSLESAVDTARAEARLKEILPEELVEHFLATREWEVRQYQDAVTDWEIARYFEVI